jgi:hypothetical protein
MSKRIADAIEETERDSDYQLAIRPILTRIRNQLIYSTPSYVDRCGCMQIYAALRYRMGF